jgi:hypothetical protein
MTMDRLRTLGSAVALALISVATLGDAAVAQTAEPNDYGDPTSWLCLPGRDDACAIDLTTTVVGRSGSLTTEAWEADPDAPIDCFYVYPTVSRDRGGNSDMTAGPEENGVVRSQLARFGSKCRIFAPLYRQVTLAGLFSQRPEGGLGYGLGYDDVLDAWNHYLENDNEGRGVVLISHSQGSAVLIRLIAEEIDGQPVQDRLVSALLFGQSVEVPEGEVVGGSFQNIPLCQAAAEIGCTVTYASFRSTLPPENAVFGRARPGMVAACTNPGALGGGPGALDAYHSSRSIVGGDTSTEWTDPPSAIETEFVRTPGLIWGECVSRDGHSYLEVTVQADRTDMRADDIPGDLSLGGGGPSAQWGLHLIDISVAMGNLLDIVESQTEAYLRR